MDTQHLPSPDSSAWSVEHYGFADESARPMAPKPPAAPVAPVATLAPITRRPARLRVALAVAALALGLTAGGAGFAAAQATSGDGGGPGRAVVTTVDAPTGQDVRGPGGDRR